MLSNKMSHVPVNHGNRNAPGTVTKTQLQQHDKGWRKDGCGANDALLKSPSTASDSATRFFRSVSSRLTNHSVKSQLSSIKKASPFNREDQRSAFNANTHRGKNGRASYNGSDQTTPSIENGRGSQPPSLTLTRAPFFRRVNSSHDNATVEHTQTTKGVALLRGELGTRLPPGKAETEVGEKRNSIFQRIGSLRIRKKTTVEYKPIDDDNRPLDVNKDRSNFPHKLRNNIWHPALRAKEFDSCLSEEPAGPSGTSGGIRGSVSDGEEDELDDTRNSTSQRKRNFVFQRSSAAWRSFSAKSRTRSNDVLLETTQREIDIGWQREELDLELKLLCDIQEHRRCLSLLGDQNGFQNFLTHNRRHFGFSEAVFQNSQSCVETDTETVGIPSSIRNRKHHPSKENVLGFNDAEGYRSTLDSLHRFNMAHAHNTEAAFVLCEQAQLCISSTDGSQFPEEDGEEWRRVEQLLLRALERFDLGKTWEYAIDICEHLSKIYKAKFKYAELSKLLQKQANLYRKILQKPRTHPCYYLVHFVGKNFPDFLRNKRFVLRAERIESESELGRIISEEFNGAVYLSDNMQLHERMTKDSHRGFKLFKLKPVPSVSVLNAGSRKVPDAVQFFHRYNNISSFEIVASCEGESKTVITIEASLPTVSRWAVVNTRSPNS